MGLPMSFARDPCPDLTLSLPDPAVLHHLGEHFAAGYFELPGASPMRRWSRAVRRRFENRAVPPYQGELLYPAGAAYRGTEDRLLSPSYSFTWNYDDALLNERLNNGSTKEQCGALAALQAHFREILPQLGMALRQHGVGGVGYTHSIPNYGRVVHEGLDRHGERIADGLTRAEGEGDAGKRDFYLGLQDVLEGIRVWQGKLSAALTDAPTNGAPWRERLLAAYERVPFRPARDFFEGLVAYNFTYYLDDCDNPGRLDLELGELCERALAEGSLTRDEAVKLVRQLWENVDANNGWSTGIGGTAPDGSPCRNALTKICLEAAQGIRRPNLQLHIRRDMPDDLWEAALDTLATGCGLPALYNEEVYLQALRDADLGVREEDLAWHNGGGCTETMIHGRSNVGSLDAGINLPYILVQTLDEHLATAASFEELLSAYKDDMRQAVADIADIVNANQEAKARLRPQPMRSLLVDDCLETGKEFNAGGARYNWSVVNVAGLANVTDSLAAVREVVFETKELTGTELLDVLRRNFEGAEEMGKRLERCPRFGNDDPAADEIAAAVSESLFRDFLAQRPWRGGRFLASCLMFVTYADAGRPVGATPDGRRAGEPLADSAGPVQGRDKRGPTAMLKSVAKVPHRLAPGTLVVNARFTKDFFTTAAGRSRLKELVRTYFDLGGMQLQVNVVDQQVLRDALPHPERHEDLIIRIGGYSEYFNHLSPELKQTVLERTEHGM